MQISVNGRKIGDEAIGRQLAAMNGSADDRATLLAAQRAAAARELLLQRARELGIAAAEAEAGDRDEEAAIEAVIDREVRTPEPGEAECRWFYDAHPERFRSGELVFARHILFAVTPGTPIEALRRTAESTLHELQVRPERFEALARENSNCPSGQQGGNLGQLSRGETVPEFEREIFGDDAPGLLPRVVRTRYGFHVVSVDRRVEGRVIPFEAVRERIAAHLAERVQTRALAQYVHVLAGRARVEGVDLGATGSPLVQ
jgi:peptidyl-prolyl cis-trans isomerase C